MIVLILMYFNYFKMNSINDVINLLELNFYDNLLELKRILQLKMELDIWNRKLASGLDPNVDDLIDEITLEDIRKIEETNQVNMDKINQLETNLFQEINLLRNLL